MSRKTGKSQAAVERLLEERRQYEAWIHKLGEPGSSGMPGHVVDRVRSDYRNRLEDVTRQLARHVKELEANLAELEQRRDEMRTQRALREEALAEVRLRHSVGEFDDGQYTELSADHTAFIAQLAEELETTERDIARLEEVLGLVAGAETVEEPPPVTGELETEAGAGQPAAEVAAPSATADAAAATTAPEAVLAVEPVIPAPRRSGGVPAPVAPPLSGPAAKGHGRVSALDELAFIRSVAEVPAGERAAPPEPEEPAAPEPAPPPVEAQAPTAAVQEPAPQPEPAADEGALSRPVQHMQLGEPDDVTAATSRPTHLASRGSEPTVRPHDRPSEADPSAKTLRCAECGTNNLPTEWYCEKCGAELSAF